MEWSLAAMSSNMSQLLNPYRPPSGKEAMAGKEVKAVSRRLLLGVSALFLGISMACFFLAVRDAKISLEPGHQVTIHLGSLALASLFSCLSGIVSAVGLILAVGRKLSGVVFIHLAILTLSVLIAFATGPMTILWLNGTIDA
jgi:hypothetical protein